jgi:ArsR family transcriptional regulator, arsenate/arsenite/antimonite-responsive transcriptional repressor
VTTTLAPSTLERTATLFHALSDPTRLRLLRTLAKGECCVCELQDAADAGQSRVSFHLRTLKEAGILVDRKQGRWVYYAIDPEMLARMRTVLDELEPAEGKSRCC